MHKLSFTKLLLAISFLVTLVASIFPDLYSFGINSYYLHNGNFWAYPIQLIMYTFLHGSFFEYPGVLHLIMNGIFLYFFGNPLELLIGRKKYIILFIFTTLFNGILLTIFAGDVTTIGISGFCMAILAYFTLELRRRDMPDWKGGITAIIVNIIVGLIPGISLWGHLFGALAGVLFYLFNREWFRPKMVGKIAKDSGI